MKLKNFDHIVLTTSHLEECLHFYRDFLGMTVSCENGRYALLFGSCKINIHRRPGALISVSLRRRLWRRCFRSFLQRGRR